MSGLGDKAKGKVNEVKGTAKQGGVGKPTTRTWSPRAGRMRQRGRARGSSAK